MGEGLAHYEGHHTGQEGLDCVRKQASKQLSSMVSTCVPALTPLHDVPCLPAPTLLLVRVYYQGNRKQMETYSIMTPETSLKCIQINDLKENQSRALQGKAFTWSYSIHKIQHWGSIVKLLGSLCSVSGTDCTLGGISNFCNKSFLPLAHSTDID